MEYVYHGSHVSGLKVITKHLSTHQKECVYAVDNEVIAMLFACNENSHGDYDVNISIENDMPVLVGGKRIELLRFPVDSHLPVRVRP